MITPERGSEPVVEMHKVVVFVQGDVLRHGIERPLRDARRQCERLGQQAAHGIESTASGEFENRPATQIEGAGSDDVHGRWRSFGPFNPVGRMKVAEPD